MSAIKNVARFSKSPLNLMSARNAMLQGTLRDSPYSFTIEQEYPIVLAPENNCSYALLYDDTIVAHANLWPRQLQLSQGHVTSVGLVGNVATDPRYQKQGLMTRMFDELINVALKKNLAALILWSELTLFYQKLGFSSLASELRYTLKPAKNKPYPDQSGTFILIQDKEQMPLDYEYLLGLRCPSPTLTRSADEFKILLSIPDTYFFIFSNQDAVLGYFIVGKVADMQGVIHEWGASEPSILGRMIAELFAFSGWQEFMLLTPSTISDSFENAIEPFRKMKKKHPMALSRSLGAKNLNKERLFIWGLDSI